MSRIILLLIFITTLPIISGCTTNMDSHTRAAACKQLKSDLIFNGSTWDTRRAEIENAETNLQQRTYNANNCEEIG